MAAVSAVRELGALFVAENCAWDELGFVILDDTERTRLSTGYNDALSVLFYEISTDGSKLGLELSTLKQLFVAARQLRDSNKRSSQHGAIWDCADWQAGSVVSLLLAPDSDLAWHERKRALIGLSADDSGYALESRLVDLVLSKHFKSAATWAHRSWLLRVRGDFSDKGFVCIGLGSDNNKPLSAKSPSTARSALLRAELAACAHAAERYARCYNAWSYRCELLPLLDAEHLGLERQVLRKWMRSHVSDASAMACLRQAIAAAPMPSQRDHWVIEEVELTSLFVVQYPGHEALWQHYRGLAHLILQNMPAQELTRLSERFAPVAAKFQQYLDRSDEEEEDDQESFDLLDGLSAIDIDTKLMEPEQLNVSDFCTVLCGQLRLAYACAHDHGCSRPSIQQRCSLAFIVFLCRCVQARLQASSGVRLLTKGLPFALPGTGSSSWNPAHRTAWLREAALAVANVCCNNFEN